MITRKFFVYFFFIPLIYSCKNRFFRAASGGMENTIMTGQNFYVEPTEKFERNDIVVFNYFGNDYNSPTDEPGKYKMHWEKRIYRLIACSGDRLEIRNGDVLVNNRPIPAPPLALFNYEIRSKVYIADFEDKDPNVITMQKTGDTTVYILPLTVKEAQDYERRKPAILSVRRRPPDYPISDTSFAKGSKKGKWSIDNYGPLVIPSPGETIQIDSFNYKIYKNIPNVRQGNYPLKEKLYFLLGDNRYGSEDSRFIGLIPHSKMYGIVK